MDGSVETLPRTMGERLEGVCGRCQAPLPPPRSRKATTPRKWCSAACRYQGFLARKVTAQVVTERGAYEKRLTEARATLDAIRRLAEIGLMRLEKGA